MRAAALALLLAAPAAADPVEDLARRTLTAMQRPSFAAGVEYCAYIVEGPNGSLRVSPVTRGEVDSCYAADWAEDEWPVASIHTHGSFAPDYDSEIPSDSDVIGDRDEGVDGYVATPGGRFWFVDGRRGKARQICGIGCLPQDPAFMPGAMGPVRRTYTVRQLRDHFAD